MRRPFTEPVRPPAWRSALFEAVLLVSILQIALQGILGRFLDADFPFPFLYNWEKSTHLQTAPWLGIMKQAWSSDRFPLWNPFQGLGMPLLGNFMSQPLHPSHWACMAVDDPVGCYLGLARWRIGLYALICHALARRLGFGRWPSLMGAVITGSGYWAIYSHSLSLMDAVTASPAVLLANTFWMARRRSASWMGTAAVAVWALLSGKPGMVFHAFALGATHLAVCGRRGERAALLAGYLGAWTAAGLACAPALLTFLEAFGQSTHYHLPGHSLTHADIRQFSAFLNLPVAIELLDLDYRLFDRFAVLRYPTLWEAWNDRYDRNLLLTLLPPVCGFSFLIGWPVIRHLATRPRIVALATVVGVLSLGALYGLTPFRILQVLPPFNRFGTKDLYPTLLTCNAILIAGGLEMIAQGRLRRRDLAAAFAIVTAALVGGSALSHRRPEAFSLGLAVGSQLAVFAVFSAAALLRSARRLSVPASLALIAFAFIADQGWVHRRIPHFNRSELEMSREIFRHLPRSDRLPPPRLAVVSPIVLPNQLAAAGYADYRIGDVLNPRRYGDWIIAGGSTDAAGLQRDTLYNYYVRPPVPQYLLDSTRRTGLTGYLSHGPWRMGDRLPSLLQAVESDRSGLRWEAPEPRYLGAIDGSGEFGSQRVLLLHPPSRLQWTMPGGAASALQLEWSTGTEIWRDSVGDSMTVEARVDDAAGRSVHSIVTLDPRRQSEDRRAHRMRMDLSSLGPAPFTLTLQSHPGPVNDPTRDYLVLLSAVPMPQPSIGEMTEERLGDSAYRLYRVPPPPMGGRFHWLGEGPTEGMALVEATVDSYRLRVDRSAGGTLINADLAYPGWRAWVDGREIPIRIEQAALRRMEIPEGARWVEIRYQPWSFRMGLWATLSALPVAAGLGIMAARHRRPAIE